MEDKKKKPNWLLISIIALFVIYIAIYIFNMTGYYDGSIRRRVEFTSEQIEKFESDVEAGKEIDVNEYLKGQTKDYSNAYSKLGYSINSGVDKFLNEGLKSIAKVLSKLFT